MFPVDMTSPTIIRVNATAINLITKDERKRHAEVDPRMARMEAHISLPQQQWRVRGFPEALLPVRRGWKPGQPVILSRIKSRDELITRIIATPIAD